MEVYAIATKAQFIINFFYFVAKPAIFTVYSSYNKPHYNIDTETYIHELE